MEPPTPPNWFPSATVGRLVVVLLLVATVSLSAPVLAQDTADAEGSFDVQGEQLVLERGDQQTVAGTVSLDEGETVMIRIRSSSSENPFLKSDEATVDEDGDFTAVFDTSDVGDENSTVEFTASLHTADGTRLARADGVVVGKNADFTTMTTTTTTTEPTTTTETSTETTTEPSSVDTPGFGVAIPIVAIALVAGTLLARQIWE